MGHTPSKMHNATWGSLGAQQLLYIQGEFFGFVFNLTFTMIQC